MIVIKAMLKKLKIFNIRGRLSFLAKAQNTIISAAFILALSSGVSALLGLVKARLLTSYFGVSDQLGVFYTADKIPNLIYSVLVVGAISTIFIPIFTEALQKDENKAWETASSIINIGVLAFVIAGISVVIFATPLIKLISLNSFTTEQISLGANLMRIMISAQLILVISSFATSVLQSFKRFLIPALAPILYNLGMIGGIILLSESMGIYGPAVGVIIGAALHLAIQLPVISKIGFQYTFELGLKKEATKEMFVLVPPRMLSVMFAQLIVTINNSLAILISTTSVVILKFASQLQFFPVHLFGASMATASLPVLSEHINHDQKKFKKIFLTTLHQMFFLVIPASVILLVLRVPLVRIVYGVSNFPWEATVRTSYALAFFSLSIFAQSAFYLLTRAFYALKDTFTPVKVTAVTLIINVSSAAFFVSVLGLGVWSIALSYTIAAYLDMTILMWLLSKKLGGFDLDELLTPFIKISYSAVLMGISLYIPLKGLDQLVFDTTRTVNLLILTGISGIAGTAVYLFFTKILDVEEIELFYKLMRRLKAKGILPVLPSIIPDSKEGL